MSSIKFVFQNLIDTATITSGSGNMSANLPVTNIAIQGRTRVARTTNTAAMVININFGSTAVNVGGAAIVRHNLTDGVGTWRVVLYDGENQTGSTVYDSTSLAVLDTGVDASISGHKYSYKWFTNTAAKSARVTLTDASNADGYLEVARVVLGTQITSAVNMNYGASFGWDEDTKQTRTEGGSLRSDNLPSYRFAKIELKELTEAERSLFSNGIQIVGKRKELLVSLYPDLTGELERDNTILCKFKTTPVFDNWVHNTYRLKMDMVES